MTFASLLSLKTLLFNNIQTCILLKWILLIFLLTYFLSLGRCNNCLQILSLILIYRILACFSHIYFDNTGSCWMLLSFLNLAKVERFFWMISVGQLMAIGLCILVLVHGPDDLQSFFAISAIIHTDLQGFLTLRFTQNWCYLWKIMRNNPINFISIFPLRLTAVFRQQQSLSHTFVDVFPRLPIIICFGRRPFAEAIRLLHNEFFHYIKLNNLTIEQNGHQAQIFPSVHPPQSSLQLFMSSVLEIKQMKLTHAYYNNEKLTQVINLSSNYKKHRENVATVKPVIDFTDQKHMKKALKLSSEKDHYTHNVRNLKLTQLKRQNDEILKRIVGVRSPIKKELSPKRSPSKKDNISLERSPSRQSVTSVSSQKSCASNFRRRTLRQQEIERENKKIAARILHPKMAKEMNYLKLQQSYSRVRSRFSERSQSIMQSLALDNLKLDKKNVQFLPQLSFKRLDRTVQHQNKTARLNTSKNSTNPKANTTLTQRQTIQ